MSKFEKAYIYVLKDPRTDAIRYVGQTFVKPCRRLSRHISEVKQGHGSKGKQEWITELLESGVKPSIEVVEETTADNADLAEAAWYERLVKDCDLLNSKYISVEQVQLRIRIKAFAALNPVPTESEHHKDKEPKEIIFERDRYSKKISKRLFGN